LEIAALSTIPAIPVQTDILEIDADQDWRESIGFRYFDTDGITKLDRNFTGASVIGGLANNVKFPGARFDLTSAGASPNLLITGRFVTTEVARGLITALPDGLYDFGLTMVRADGVNVGLVAAKRRLKHGVLL
jgi:hypothetical protein